MYYMKKERGGFGKMSKYVATRKDVCAGQLLKTISMTFKVYDGNKNEISEDKFEELGIPEISVFGDLICRGMLFNVNENGLANDLIYTTPTNYPIEGIEPKIDVESEFIIENYVELEELLKYLKYGVDLTQKDLNQIYRKIITHKWWLERHMELFGWKKMRDEKTGLSMGYGSDGIQTIPMNIYNNLSWITKNGKPHQEEPSYSLIKRK